MKKSKWMLGAAAVLALSVALAGCGGGDKKAEKKAGGTKGELMVYTSIYPDIIDNMCKPSLAKAFPEMKVNWFQGGTEKVVTKITGEIKAKKIGADVLMVADPSYYLKLDDQKLLLPYKSKEEKNLINDKDAEEVDIDSMDIPEDELDLKLYNLMKKKMVQELSYDNIDEVIYKISDKILERYSSAVRRLYSDGN